MPAACPWCADPDDDEFSPALCDAHRAEYHGESVDSLARGEAVEAAEYNEWVLGR